MQPSTYTATIDGRYVHIYRHGQLIGTGRWTGKRIEDCPVSIIPDATEDSPDFTDRSACC